MLFQMVSSAVLTAGKRLKNTDGILPTLNLKLRSNLSHFQLNNSFIFVTDLIKNPIT